MNSYPYSIAPPQTYDPEQLRLALVAAKIGDFSIQGYGASQFSIQCDPLMYAAVDAVIQAHIAINWVLRAAQTDAINRINSQADSALRALNDKVSMEWPLWHTAEEEAKAYAANPAALTPMIDAYIAEAGGVKATVVNSVNSKAATLARNAGTIIGRRAKRLRQIQNLVESTTYTDDEKIALLNQVTL